MEERLLEIIRLALKYNASDIHFEKKNDEVAIEMAFDGAYRKVKTKLNDYKLIKYLKYLSNINVEYSTYPRCGSFYLEIDNQLVNLRFACIDFKNNGYTAVLRIL